jgi:hypothetical protein
VNGLKAELGGIYCDATAMLLLIETTSGSRKTVGRGRRGQVGSTLPANSLRTLGEAKLHRYSI